MYLLGVINDFHLFDGIVWDHACGEKPLAIDRLLARGVGCFKVRIGRDTFARITQYEVAMAVVANDFSYELPVVLHNKFDVFC